MPYEKTFGDLLDLASSRCQLHQGIRDGKKRQVILWKYRNQVYYRLGVNLGFVYQPSFDIFVGGEDE